MEFDLTDKPEEIEKIKNETGWRTIPIIMIDGKRIGGLVLFIAGSCQILRKPCKN